ncbi:MAG: hypothetical protein UCH90_03065 [Acutalibacteraceae bacterium]|nr:hypothetical protein [Acutalibacteraceae bacterium]
MKFAECVNNVSTFIDLKRLANEYVIDYKRLSYDELKAAMIKTAPQYYNQENVYNTIKSLKLHEDESVRTLLEIIIREVLLNEDNFSLCQKDLEDEVILYEQSILDRENEEEELFEKENIKLLSYVIDAAWENNLAISADEQNLIYKLKKKLQILDDEYELIQAHRGIFPKHGNVLHTRDEIGAVRKLLQQRGILFVVRDSQGTDYDILPEEIADVIRTYYNVDIKKFSYEKLLESKYVKKKAYLIDILQKASVELGKNETIESLSYKVMRHIKAHNLIGGFTARDGLNGTDLVKWCNDIGVSCRGSKNELIDRIVAYYDDIQKIEVTEDDERALYYEFYEDLASRNLDKLRKQGIIDKDLECEHKFEEATITYLKRF